MSVVNFWLSELGGWPEMRLDFLQCTRCPQRMSRPQHWAENPGLLQVLGLQASSGLELGEPTELSNSCQIPSKETPSAAEPSSKKSLMGILQVVRHFTSPPPTRDPLRASGHVQPPDLAADQALLPGRSWAKAKP